MGWPVWLAAERVLVNCSAEVMLLMRLSITSHSARMCAPDEGGGADAGAQASADLVGEQGGEVAQDVEESAAESSQDSGVPVAPAATLRLVRGGVETGVGFSFAGSAIIGRFDPAVGPIDIDLSGLDEGSYVSRKHARISFQDGTWILEDVGSSNGTFVLDGDEFRRIMEPTPIEDGATIVFGNARFLFRVNGPAEEEAATEGAESG